ncbi:MAG: hypothetical protein ACRDHG_12850 [Anaerolineales bacterium]
MRRAVRRKASLGASTLAAVTLLASAALYLSTAQRTYRIGLPLDDAWIHQTYARNLAELGQWAFIPDQPSAGSTAPLWTAILAVGYWLRVNPLVYAYGVGLVMLGLVAWLAGRWVRVLVPERAGWVWIVGGLVTLEWHLVWASLSGMEVLPLAGLALLICLAAEAKWLGPGWLGLLVGVGVWLRPDALGLVVVPLGILGLGDRRKILPGLVRLAAGLSAVLVPYLLWQQSLSGEIWPNTAFAKQAEYAALREIPFAIRLAAQAGVPGGWLGAEGLDPGGPLIGVMAILAPGLALYVLSQLRARRWDRLLPLVWSAAYLGLYAARLPATYQHGRYAMPVLPVWMALACAGMLGALRPRSDQFGRRVLARTWIGLVPIIAGYFWIAGAQAYGQDVAIIESEMVETARWVAGHTAPGALVAAHDIGALGYFGQRTLIDLAGLIDSSVVPILRDEQALARYVSERGADYLMTFPGWYPQLTAGKVPVYVTGARFSPAAGSENMAVYRWEASSFAPCGGCAILAKLWQGRP